VLKEISYVDEKTGKRFTKNKYISDPINDKGYLFWTRKSCVKSYLDIPLPECFTWADKGRINELRYYIIDGQLLAYKSGNVIKPLTCKEISRIFELSDRKTKEIVKKMKKNSVVKEISIDGLKYYAFNPVYGFKGNRLTLNVFIFFQDELKEHLPEWAYCELMQQVKEIKPNIKVLR
jgi:hypothetical protein